MIRMAMPYMGFQPADKTAAMRTIRDEGLYTVVGLGTAKKMAKAGLAEQVRDYATAIREGGVSTFEVTARYGAWEDAVKAIPDGVVRALGTQANILTLFRAIGVRVMVNVAAHDMKPLIGERAVVSTQADALARFKTYMAEHYEAVCEKAGITSGYEIDRIREDPTTIDPIDFGRAHNAIVIPAGYTIGEIMGIVARGGTDGQKAFNFADRSAKMWGKLLAAVPDVYRGSLYICATGGRNIDNLRETLEVPFVNQAGMSSLIADDPEASKNLALEMRVIVDEVLTAKGVKK